MKETIKIDDFRKESKKREFKEKVKEKVKEKASNAYQKTKAFCINNREIVIPVAITLSTGLVKISKMAVKSKNLKKEEQLKEEYCYDRSLGHYWKLRRPLTNDEWLEIDQRKRDGERLSDILAELKVLY